MKKILVIDARGGGIGKQLIAEMKKRNLKVEITAIGTNSVATGQMLKAGADIGATGENPVLVACRKTDYIMGPIGIAIADSMHGEITPKMARAVGQSDAKRLFIPMNTCGNYVVGIREGTISSLIEQAVDSLEQDPAFED